MSESSRARIRALRRAVRAGPRPDADGGGDAGSFAGLRRFLALVAALAAVYVIVLVFVPPGGDPRGRPGVFGEFTPLDSGVLFDAFASARDALDACAAVAGQPVFDPCSCVDEIDVVVWTAGVLLRELGGGAAPPGAAELLDEVEQVRVDARRVSSSCLGEGGGDGTLPASRTGIGDR